MTFKINPWLGLDRLFFWLARQFLTLWTRGHSFPASADELGLDPSRPVVYVLRDASLADLLMLDRQTRALNLPSPLTPLTLNGKPLSRRHFHLYRRRRLLGRERVTLHPPRLGKLVDHVHDQTDADVQLLPVSLFWGRAPEKESSLWKIILSYNWSPPGLIKKFFIILTQGRQLHILFGRPLALRDLMHENGERDLTRRKAQRILRVHFRRQQEAVIGPDLSHRRMIANTLVRTPPVREAIEQAARSENQPVEKLEKRARHYAIELAADYSHTVIRFLEVVLSWLWNQLYDGLRVYNFDKLNNVAGDYEIIYVPCHRSHIDYLLLSYLVYKRGLVPPHIAAGINLNMPVIGTILRRGGAFFMRRSFRKDRLYAAVFSEYLHTITTRGFSIEYFVEGTRSRSGRMLNPRTGMLAMTVKSFLRDARKPIAFVPVYVGYEKVIEARSYMGELHTGKKSRESVGGLIRALKFLRGNFGEVHVNFGDPILLDRFLDEQAPDWREKALGEDEMPPWFRATINELGERVVTGINAAAVANPVNLLSLALLATPKHTMDMGQLRRQLALYVTLLREAPYSQASALAQADPDAIIEYGLENDFLQRVEHELGDLVTTDAQTALQMAYVRNNSLHLFVLPGLLCSLFLNARSIDNAQLHRLVHLLYPFFRNEYFLHWSDAELDSAIDGVLRVLEDQGLIRRDGDQLQGTPINSPESDLLEHLGRTVMPSLERFYLTIRLLVQYGDGQLSSAELEERAHQTAQRLSLLYEFNSPEFFDKTVLRDFIQKLQHFGLTETDDAGKLTFNEQLTTLDEEAQLILSPHIGQSIQRITRRE